VGYGSVSSGRGSQPAPERLFCESFRGAGRGAVEGIAEAHEAVEGGRTGGRVVVDVG
jgi:hypothetical protein